MDIFDIMALVGGLSLFLFGMNIMGQALERRAGKGLKSLLGRLTGSKMGGITTGIGVTMVTQSSSATTVMIVGFVNSGIITLSQAINVIIGANVGTTSTAWVLSLNGISSDNVFMSLLKPTSFTPVFAFIGIIMYLFSKKSKTKDLGAIFLGFATLMSGMQAMSGSVDGLSDIPQFTNLLVLFSNPIFGVIIGTVLTAAIQSSAASIGILQALAITGQVTNGAAIPIVMGQNIGTCITAILSAIGSNKNGKRAAFAHLLFNVTGTVVWLAVFYVIRATLAPAILDRPVTLYGIAAIHTIFNVLSMIIIAPFSNLLEKAVIRILPESKSEEFIPELDERIFNTPTVALEQCRLLTVDMAATAVESLGDSLGMLFDFDKDMAEKIREDEEKSDHYEDALGTYLVKISGLDISEADSMEAAKLLKMIGDFERISDHAVNILESAEEMQEKDIVFSGRASVEIRTICTAVEEILDITFDAFANDSPEKAVLVEPLEQVIDDLKEKLRINHIRRLQQGDCSIDAGFVWTDLLTNIERTSDHCSNIAGTIIDIADHRMNLHESLREFNHSPEFKVKYDEYKEKYSL